MQKTIRQFFDYQCTLNSLIVVGSCVNTYLVYILG